MRARPGMVPGEARDLVLDRERHKVVIGGMVFDPIDPHAVAVEGLQFRAVAVGLFGLLRHFGAADQAAECRDAILRPGRSLAPHAFPERRVLGPEVPVTQMRRHVEDFMRGQRRARPERNRHRTGLAMLRTWRRRLSSSKSPASCSIIAPPSWSASKIVTAWR